MTYEEIINENPVMLVEFYAPWCPHCRRMMPIVVQVKELLDGQAVVTQFNIDDSRNEAEAAEVESVPTFIVYRDGEEQWRHSGEIDGNYLLEKVQSYI